MRVRKKLQQMSVRELENKIQSMLRNAIRNGIGTVRIADHLNDRIFASTLLKRLTNLVILIDTAKQCTLAECGKAYEEFRKTGILKNFTGYGEKPATFDECHFDEASLCVMTFSETYGNDPDKYADNIVYIPKKDDVAPLPDQHPEIPQEENVDESPQGEAVKQIGNKQIAGAQRRRVTKRRRPVTATTTGNEGNKSSKHDGPKKATKRKAISGQFSDADDSDSDFQSNGNNSVKFAMKKKKKSEMPSLISQKSPSFPSATSTDSQQKIVLDQENRQQQKQMDLHNSIEIANPNLGVQSIETSSGINPQSTSIPGANENNQNDLILRISDGTPNFSSILHISNNKDGFCEISLEDGMSLDSDMSSNSQSQSPFEEVPDFYNATIDKLKEMAAMAGQDIFIDV